MHVMKRILLLGVLICICQISYAAPSDEAKRINELYAIPIEVTVLNWYQEVNDLVQHNKRNKISDSDFRRYLADIAIKKDSELRILMESLHYSEKLPKELEKLGVSIINTGAIGRVLARDTLDLSYGVLSIEEYARRTEYNINAYARSVNWTDREYFNITGEFRDRK